ncbi:MAG: LytTR family DNA-binding domain-containing protein [Crocinitomicaceae bacterium]
MLKAAILDDDAISRKILENFISNSSHLELVAQYENPVTALKELSSISCDLVFLDMEMPEMTGLEFIAAAKNIPQVIIASSKSDYAADSYNFDVTDYLVKPIETERFNQAVEKAVEISTAIQSGPEQNHFFIKKNKSYSRVKFEDIDYIEALADYVQINADSGRFTVLSTMKSIANRLPQKKFIRVHRSYIVALDKIMRIDDNLIVVGEKSIPVSRSYKEDLMKNLNLL